MSEIVKKLSSNVEGRDFIVGDLHGCYDELLNLLSVVSFNVEKDRLISTGDLIDRGPKPVECLELLNQKWFYSVKGNHESLIAHKSFLIGKGNPETIKTFSESDMDYINSFPKKLLNKLDDLPYAIDRAYVI